MRPLTRTEKKSHFLWWYSTENFFPFSKTYQSCNNSNIKTGNQKEKKKLEIKSKRHWRAGNQVIMQTSVPRGAPGSRKPTSPWPSPWSSQWCSWSRQPVLHFPRARRRLSLLPLLILFLHSSSTRCFLCTRLLCQLCPAHWLSPEAEVTNQGLPSGSWEIRPELKR